jgi:hypothetical protein
MVGNRSFSLPCILAANFGRQADLIIKVEMRRPLLAASCGNSELRRQRSFGFVRWRLFRASSCLLWAATCFGQLPVRAAGGYEQMDAVDLRRSFLRVPRHTDRS